MEIKYMYFCNNCSLTKVENYGDCCDTCKDKVNLPVRSPSTGVQEYKEPVTYIGQLTNSSSLGTLSSNLVNGIVKNITYDTFKGGIGEHILYAALNGEKFSISGAITIIQVSITKENSCQLVAYGKNRGVGEISVGNKIEANGYFNKKNQFIIDDLVDITTGVTYRYNAQSAVIAQLILAIIFFISIFFGILMYLAFRNMIVSIATTILIVVMALFSSNKNNSH